MHRHLRTRNPLRSLGALVAAATLALGATGMLAAPAGAAPRPGSKLVLTTPPLAQYTDRVDLAPTGPSIGDLVTFRAPVSKAGSSAVIGFMTGSLRNTAIDFPKPGSAVREVNLVFVLRDGKDELVVGGAAEYPLDGATLPLPSTTVRPLLGGSGRYAGARGEVVTVHAADDTWTHTFRFTS